PGRGSRSPPGACRGTGRSARRAGATRPRPTRNGRRPRCGVPGCDPGRSTRRRRRGRPRRASPLAADGAEGVVVRSGPRRSLVTPVVLVRIVPSAAVGGAGADGALGLVVLLGAGEVLHGGGEGVLGAVLELEDHLHLVP